MKSNFWFSIGLPLLATLRLSAATLYVSLGSPHPAPPYTTWATAATNIQDAVNVAPVGAVVLVSNGLYLATVNATNPVTLISVNGARQTVIDGAGSRRCVTLGDGANLSGFTLTNGWSTAGGGVWCNSTNAFITNCVIIGNAGEDGGGAYSGTFYDCLICSNSVLGAQYGIGGGTDQSVLYNCTVVGNKAFQGGGIALGTCANCILYYNSAQYDTNFVSGRILNYCCTFPMPTNGVGNFTNPPLFADLAAGDFHLQTGSPCINAGNNALINTPIDLDANPRISSDTVDLGAYEFQFSGPPVITRQPASQSIYSGDNAEFFAGSGGSSPLSWQWLFDRTAILNATNSSLALFNVGTNRAGDYSVIITNSLGSVTSQVAVLTIIEAAPSISIQPASQSVEPGTNVNFTVKANGSLPLFWQWELNGSPLQDATNSSFSLPMVIPGQAGSYSVVITNYLGAITSQVAVLTILPGDPPQIIDDPWLQPAYMSVAAGSNVTFHVHATGSPPLFYQWLFSGTKLLDATNSALTLPSAMPDQAGYYLVTVTNYLGSVTGQVVQLDVQGGPPFITQQPASQTVYAGADVTFTVGTASPLPWLSWQWFFEDAAIRDATNSSLLLTAVRSDQAGGYFVVITNVLGAQTSQVAVLNVLNTAPQITLQPTDQTRYVGSNVTFISAAVGSLPLSWQWLLNGNPVSLATNSSLTLAPIRTNQAGAYSVVVTNNVGSITSQVAILTVLDTAPVLTLQPASQSAHNGETILFTAQAKGSMPLYWQWVFNGAALQNATNSILSLPGVTAAQAGTYAVIVSNALGSVTSSNAELQVASPATHYVWQNSPGPAAPYTNWSTAAHAIQEAVDTAGAGDEVIVTNGLYATGGRTVGAGMLTNRVVVEKPMSIRSVNGPDVTVIQGYQVPGMTNGDAAVRCLYLGSNVFFSGFTLTQGATRAASGTWMSDSDFSGGGVYSGTYGGDTSLLTDCKLIGNAALSLGGGAFVCPLDNCLVVGNTADTGGGTCFCGLTNCTITGNSAVSQGGGAVVGAIFNCILYYNTSRYQSDSDWLADLGGIIMNSCTPPANYPWQNVAAPPLFVDPAHGDFHVQPNSPCINAGDNAYVVGATDLDGNPRIVGGVVDIGAYEVQGQSSTIPLAWLQQYGLPTDGSADSLDSDGDGMSNWQEWVSGTSPTNALSQLRLLSARSSGTSIIVTWQSAAGVNYFLSRSRGIPPTYSLAATNFAVIAANIAGQAGTTTYTDTNTPGAGPFLYRVGVAAP